METKFRAWDKVAKKYIDTIYIDCDGNLWIDTDPFGIDMSGCKRISMSSTRVSKERIKIEFFTGLTDKNEKEIYQGDLVKVHRFIEVLGDGYGVSEGEIEYEAEVQILSGSVYLETKEIAYDEVTYSDFVVCMSGLHEESITLIGHIHQ